MTVPNTTRRAGPFNGNGVTVSFPFSFKLFSDDDLVVVITDDAGVESTLVLDSDYSVLINADQDASPGGSVTYPVSGTPLAVGRTLTVAGDEPYTQDLDLPAGGSFSPRALENALDRIVFQIQQLGERLGRSMTLPLSAAGADTSLPVPSANAIIGWDAAGTALQNYEALPVGSAVASAVSYTPAGAGAVDTTVQSKLRESVSVFDYMSTALAADVRASTALLDTTVAITAALAATPTGGTLVLPPYTMRITSVITVPDGVTLAGSGYGSVLKQVTRSASAVVLGNNSTLTNVRLMGDSVNSGGVDSFTGGSAIVISGKRGARVIGNWIHGWEYNGVYIANSYDYEVSGNRFWGQLYSNNSGSDVILYSGTAGARGRISGNWFFSNNSQALFANALGHDTEILVEGNIAATLDPSTFVPVVSGSLLRRHGYILGYVGGGGGRIVCSGNISYNTRQTGVYWQGASSTTGSALITGNYIRDAGVNAVEPALAAGIYVAAQGKADVISSNIVDGVQEGGFLIAAGISILPGNTGVAAENNTLVHGNSVYNAEGHGIYVGSNAQNVRVVDNTFSACGEAYIAVIPDAAFTGGGFIDICGNRGFGLTKATYGIFIDPQIGTADLTIKDNTVVGFNNSTAATTNAGIFWTSWAKAGLIQGNKLSTFYCGVSSGNYVQVRATARFKSNTFASVNACYHVSTTANGSLVTEDDVLGGNTYQATALLAGNRAAWPGTYTYNGAALIYVAAIPTVGNWVAGDRAQLVPPVVGQPKAWSCTVAGTPGTWVSEGNL